MNGDGFRRMRVPRGYEPCYYRWEMSHPNPNGLQAKVVYVIRFGLMFGQPSLVLFRSWIKMD